MKKIVFHRLTALALSLALLLSCAQALTAGEVRELLEKYYVDAIPDAVYGQDTVAGVLEALGDPYTEYYDAEAYQAFLDMMRDTVLVGVGIESQAHERGLELTRIFEDSPAEEAGLQPGDIITAVDGRSAAGELQETVASWLRGEEGTAVTVTVLRGADTRTYTMKRREVVVPATTTMLVDGHIGYIDCSTFGAETLGHFEDGIAAYDGAVDRWVVDLRLNGGGDVDASVQAAGAFAGPGYLAYLRDRSGEYGAYVRETAASTLDPVIVLTSRYTASASEIFASAIRDRQQGISVGTRTYGKGVAQAMLDGETEPDYFSDGDALKVTAYRFFSYNGAATDHVGIIPDVLVSDEQAEAVAYLLSASGPKGDTAGLMRVDLGWRWYVDLETALEENFRAAFTALLEALPEGTPLRIGTGGVDGWREVTPAQAAEEYGLTAYTPRGFADAADSPFGRQINLLGTYGIVTGDGAGSYRPGDGLTRAELCALLVKAIRFPAYIGQSPFADVAADAWYAPAVNALYAAGLVDGYDDGAFRPDGVVDRQQLITVLARMAGQLSVSFGGAAQKGPEGGEYGDELNDFDPWARPYAWLLSASQSNPFGTVNLLWDDLSALRPREAATRGEAAALMYNLLSFIGILPA